VRRAAVALGIALGLAGAAPAAAAALHAPGYFERPSVAGAAAPRPCGMPPAPVTAVAVDVVYRHDTAQQRQNYDEIDPAALAAYQKQVAGLHQYQHELTLRADDYVRSGAAASAACVLDWLDAWARADAMLAPTAMQGRFEEKWHAATVCLAALRIVGAGGLPADRLARVRGYLVRLGQAARDGNHADGKPAGVTSDDDVITRSNHAYWAGLAAMACAIHGDDRGLFDWGLAQFRMAMADVTPEGFLPAELKRGARALGYHCLSLDALVMMAELAEANGVHAYDEHGGALQRLALTTARGYADPAPFAAAAGKPQEPNQTFAKFYLSWAEIDAAHLGSRTPPEIARLVAANRPLRHRWLGGDMTLLMARAGAH
jgi:poly(beta-D-mannuronate) lyase